MLDKVLLDSRHKFVYFEDDKKDTFVNSSSEYPALIDSDKPIAVYIKDNGLPKAKDIFGLDVLRIRAFHNSYYEFLIALSIVDTLISQIDKDILNERLKDVFEFYSTFSEVGIENIDDLRMVLNDSMEGYKSLYINYLETGDSDFKKNIPLVTVIMDTFVPKLKKVIGLKESFTVLYDYDEELSSTNMMALNCYIGSRCNGYLSMNILCGNKEWKCYYDVVGNLIENIHDFVEIYDDKTKKKIRHV